MIPIAASSALQNYSNKANNEELPYLMVRSPFDNQVYFSCWNRSGGPENAIKQKTGNLIRKGQHYGPFQVTFSSEVVALSSAD